MAPLKQGGNQRNAAALHHFGMKLRCQWDEVTGLATPVRRRRYSDLKTLKGNARGLSNVGARRPQKATQKINAGRASKGNVRGQRKKAVNWYHKSPLNTYVHMNHRVDAKRQSKYSQPLRLSITSIPTPTPTRRSCRAGNTPVKTPGSHLKTSTDNARRCQRQDAESRRPRQRDEAKQHDQHFRHPSSSMNYGADETKPVGQRETAWPATSLRRRRGALSRG